MLSIPVDVLREILEHLGPADLAKICPVNKICCSCSQDVLYRNVSDGKLLCRTLAQSTDLARRVRSFITGSDDRITSDALRNMTFLHRLIMGTPDSYVLEGCTFKLVSLDCECDDDEGFRKFINSQPDITDIGLYSAPDDSCPLDESS